MYVCVYLYIYIYIIFFFYNKMYSDLIRGVVELLFNPISHIIYY